METNLFSALSKIKQVDPPASLDSFIQKKIQEHSSRFVPLYKVAVAASLLLCFIIGEYFYATQHNHIAQSNDSLDQILTINNNTLYHE